MPNIHGYMNSGRRANHQMVMPPSYNEPGHEPPPYHVALSHSEAPQPHIESHNRLEEPIIHRSRTDSSRESPTTVRAESVPPPYSSIHHDSHQPPHNSIPTNNALESHQTITDVDLYFSGNFSTRPSTHNFFHYQPVSRTTTHVNVEFSRHSSFQEFNFSNNSSDVPTPSHYAPPPYSGYPSTTASASSQRGSRLSTNANPLSSLQRTITQMASSESIRDAGRDTSADRGHNSVAAMCSYNLNNSSIQNSAASTSNLTPRGGETSRQASEPGVSTGSTTTSNSIISGRNAQNVPKPRATVSQGLQNSNKVPKNRTNVPARASRAAQQRIKRTVNDRQTSNDQSSNQVTGTDLSQTQTVPSGATDSSQQSPSVSDSQLADAAHVNNSFDDEEF